MRTKTLFLAAAALAAGLASSMAQSNVYSVNIVGYYGVTVPANSKTLMANQLDNTSTTSSNTLNDLCTALPNKTVAYVWTGTSFAAISKTSGSFTPNSTLAQGSGFFILTPSTAGTITNTFVGSANVTNFTAFPDTAKVLVGAKLPFSGNMNDAGPNTLNLGSGLVPNKSVAYLWAGSSFTAVSKTSGSWTGNPAIAVGQGFFMSSKGASTWPIWIQ
jgi:hypothetical protein